MAAGGDRLGGKVALSIGAAVQSKRAAHLYAGPDLCQLHLGQHLEVQRHAGQAHIVA